MKVYEPLCWIWDDYSASTVNVKDMGLYSTMNLAKERIEAFYKEYISNPEEVLKITEGTKFRDDDKYNLSVMTKKYEFYFRIIERDLVLE